MASVVQPQGPGPATAVPPPMPNGAAVGPVPPQGPAQPQANAASQQNLTPLQKLASVNEQVWLQIGNVAELMNDLDRALTSYESALRQNPYSIPAMNHIATILREKQQYPRAVEYFQSILNLDQSNGDAWGSLGHCYLMMDDLQKAYSAYQQALYHLQNPKEPKLWYGIGILYDRYGSFEHAEEAFSQVMRMDPNFDKANEIYFRLGIIYKQQQRYPQSLECFRYILKNPPRPLTEIDIWFQIGHVYEQQKEYTSAKEAYERVLAENPNHSKVLQQLGWLYHQQSSSFSNQDLAIQYLTKSLECDGQDAQSWYLLGRCYMQQRNYSKAYEAYQQAVYRDGRNPTFWCSIGVLYYQINQYRDALDAYSRAIRLNPYISEVWYDLGTLYESCNNQISDALDAYTRASELDPTNPHIKTRLQLLRSGQASQGPRPAPGGAGAPPLTQDINPTAYAGPAPSGAAPSEWGTAAAANRVAPPGPPSELARVGPPPALNGSGPSGPQGRPRSPPPPPPFGAGGAGRGYDQRGVNQSLYGPAGGPGLPPPPAVAGGPPGPGTPGPMGGERLPPVAPGAGMGTPMQGGLGQLAPIMDRERMDEDVPRGASPQPPFPRHDREGPSGYHGGQLPPVSTPGSHGPSGLGLGGPPPQTQLQQSGLSSLISNPLPMRGESSVRDEARTGEKRSVREWDSPAAPREQRGDDRGDRGDRRQSGEQRPLAAIVMPDVPERRDDNRDSNQQRDRDERMEDVVPVRPDAVKPKEEQEQRQEQEGDAQMEDAPPVKIAESVQEEAKDVQQATTAPISAPAPEVPQQSAPEAAPAAPAPAPAPASAPVEEKEEKSEPAAEEEEPVPAARKVEVDEDYDEE
ncbi:glucose repression mediator protein [Saitoella coloradoensis]